MKPQNRTAQVSTKTTREAFEQFDEDSKGFLSRHELKCAILATTGILFKQNQIEPIINSFSKNNITFENFTKIIEELTKNLQQDVINREIFKSFDIRGSGYISRSDAYQVFKEVMPLVNPKTIDEVFDELDFSRTDHVSGTDFLNMLRAREM